MINELKITKVTRRDILLSLKNDIEDILRIFFNFDWLPSSDWRYENMTWDYLQHRVNNNDWDDDWFITDSRLNLLEISDVLFLELCCYCIHPNITTDQDIIKTRILILNSKLLNDGFEIIKWWKYSGFDVFYWREINLLNSKKSKLVFYTLNYKQNIKDIQGSKFPCITLVWDNWNDFGYRTYFDIYFYENEFSEWVHLKWIRIAHLQDLTTDLPREFIKLDDSFYSLFVNLEAYRIIKTNYLVSPYALNIFNSLNDLTVRKDLLWRVKDYEVFNTSLLRNSELKTLLEDDKFYSFKFRNIYKEFPVWIDFNFSDDWLLPNRMVAIIWENWSGKTTLLRNITRWLVQFSQHKENFSIRPSFTKIITISYSVFDSTKPPECTEKDINYIYCWLGESLGGDLLERLKDRFSKSLSEIEKKEKMNIWMYIIKDFFDDAVDLVSPQNSYDMLSSWQKILVTIFTEILSKIEQWSLIVFDEPETHLHPGLIFKLINTLNRLLVDYDSYLIIATHSPIVIQQIPSKFVLILRQWYVSKLPIESFWENFSTITREVFKNYEEKDIAYKELFKDLHKKQYSEIEVLNAFDNDLSINARMYLKNIFTNKWDETNIITRPF